MVKRENLRCCQNQTDRRKWCEGGQSQVLTGIAGQWSVQVACGGPGAQTPGLCPLLSPPPPPPQDADFLLGLEGAWGTGSRLLWTHRRLRAQPNTGPMIGVKIGDQT